MKNFYLTLAFLFLSLTLKAQTTVSGGIYSNTTWTKANSPYLVTSELVIFSPATLTIEPGVTISVSSSVLFNVRGNLIAVGTPKDSISFIFSGTDNIGTPTTKPWRGVLYQNSTEQSLHYCIFSGADTALRNANAFKCLFKNNNIGLAGIADSCYFMNNTIACDGNASNSYFNSNDVAITTGATKIINCQFYDNTIGIIAPQDTVRSCTFINNGRAVEEYNDVLDPQFINNYFKGNKVAFAVFDNGTYIGNTVINNDTGMFFYDYPIEVTNNTICNNNYNVVMKTSKDVNLQNNCWCSTDSAYIRSTIYDGYENLSYGLVNYMPFTPCADATVDTIYGSTNYYITNQTYKFYIDSVQNIVYKWIINGDTLATGGSILLWISNTGPQTITCTAYENGNAMGSYTLPIYVYDAVTSVISATNDKIVVYPNPNQGSFTLTTSVTNAQFTIYNSLGMPIQSSVITEKSSNITLTNTASGMYYIIVESDSGSFSQKFIVN